MLEAEKAAYGGKKKEVIDTAKKLFLEKGLNNVTMNDIMNEAGLSKAVTMIAYIPSPLRRNTKCCRKYSAI
ncbi:TetR/AcrR family transcriptional regulator [Tissierella carlieri]|uniref:TetR/AcrR family transcriptional regulator n=1 Tax=Tissierella carlieri TaxID=689904 RepID=UPI003B84A98D